MEKAKITVQTNVNATIEQVWKAWVSPEDIVKWYFASEDWHTPRAENDLQLGGKFSTRMEAKDGSFGFDFEGVYTAIKFQELIEYQLADNRGVKIEFSHISNTTQIVQTFEAETTNSLELQQGGWQAILNNFKNHVEANS